MEIHGYLLLLVPRHCEVDAVLAGMQKQLVMMAAELKKPQAKQHCAHIQVEEAVNLNACPAARADIYPPSYLLKKNNYMKSTTKYQAKKGTYRRIVVATRLEWKSRKTLKNGIGLCFV
jgi:hypothetical protein